MKKLGLIIQLLLLLISMHAMPQNLDSLETVLRTKNLTVKEQLKLYNKLSWGFLNTDVSKAKRFEREGIKISLREKDDKMCGILYHHLGIGCFYNGELDSAKYYLGIAESFSKKANDDFRLNRIYIAYAILYNSAKEYDKTINTLLQLISRLEKGNDGDLLRTAYGNLGTTYLYIHNYSLSEKYYQLCAEQSIAAKDDWKLSQSYNGLIDIHIEKKDFEKAIDYADKALVVAIRCGDFECQALTYRKKSEIYCTHYKDYNKALEFGKKGLEIARSKSNQSDISALLINLSNISYQKGEYNFAMKYALEALQTDTTDQSCYENITANIVKAGIHLNDKEKAIKYLERYYNTIEARSKKDLHQFAIDSEKKYQTEKKETEIDQLKKQRKLYLFIFLGISLILILVVLAIYYRLYISRQKRQIAEQRILQFEQETKLIATKSLLEGEEAERSRLAGDLHDGLGGLLSGIKLKLSYMKENAVITHENLVHFNHALDLLDTSIAEMRRVAHNLMPETLMHYGLRTALSHFVKQVEPEGIPIIRFSTFGDDLRYSKEIEITIYRISQELVTNALKHAHARQIDIQLFSEPNRICVQINDNGIGFDVEKLDSSKTGKGLQNIRDRVTAFNGRFEIFSQQGTGTESMIEFLIT